MDRLRYGHCPSWRPPMLTSVVGRFWPSWHISIEGRLAGEYLKHQLEVSFVWGGWLLTLTSAV